MKMNEPSLPGSGARWPRSEQHRGFVARHIGTTDEDQAAMLAVLGLSRRARR